MLAQCRAGVTVLNNVTRVTRTQPFVPVSTQSGTGLTEAQQDRREKFWAEEREFEAKVKYDQLSEEEKTIHRAHAEALQRRHFTYDDPVTGERQFTRYRHFLKGACCGTLCRHCIYDHVKVPDFKKRSRRFNTAFWVYEESDAEPEYESKSVYVECEDGRQRIVKEKISQ